MLPPRTQSFSGQYPVRFEGAPGGPFEGDVKWRGCRDFEHSTLCRALGLAQHAFYFDLPSTCRGIGSSSGMQRQRGVVNGFVMMAGRDTPVGKLTVVLDGERFRDVDPTSERDFFELSHS